MNMALKLRWIMGLPCMHVLKLSGIHIAFSFSGVSDFIPFANEVLRIPSTTAVGNSVCRDITVTDDMIVEGSETFTITVEITDPTDVVVGPNTAVIIIGDDDSE